MVLTYQQHSFHSLSNAEHLLNFHKKIRWVQPCPWPVEELPPFWPLQCEAFHQRTSSCRLVSSVIPFYQELLGFFFKSREVKKKFFCVNMFLYLMSSKQKLNLERNFLQLTLIRVLPSYTLCLIPDLVFHLYFCLSEFSVFYHSRVLTVKSWPPNFHYSSFTISNQRRKSGRSLISVETIIGILLVLVLQFCMVRELPFVWSWTTPTQDCPSKPRATSLLNSQVQHPGI